ncbi:histidine kinase [Prescottella defluvii]|nr:histidine kinase [Prescottella defluvii]
MAQWFVGVELAADVTLLVYLYTVASRYPLRVALLAAGVVEAGALLAAVRWPLALHWSEMFVLLSGPVLAGLLLGVNVRNRRNVVNALNQRAEQLERERDQQTLIAAAEERTRIAREMHDVVAHSLLVMVTLSEGAALKQAREPERAAAAMRQVSRTGRQALDDVRRLLGVLRTENCATDPSAAARHRPDRRAAGSGAGDRAFRRRDRHRQRPAPSHREPSSRCIASRQEALTNTLKHAVGAARVRVVVDCRIDSVSVDVYDDGAPPADPCTDPSTTGGHGVTGMRERAAVYDGTVSVRPTPPVDGASTLTCRCPRTHHAGREPDCRPPSAEAPDEYPRPPGRRPGARPHGIPDDSQETDDASTSSERRRTVPKPSG